MFIGQRGAQNFGRKGDIFVYDWVIKVGAAIAKTKT